jgi:hypothetical protein
MREILVGPNDLVKPEKLSPMRDPGHHDAQLSVGSLPAG